jgi:hypothetical protein
MLATTVRLCMIVLFLVGGLSACSVAQPENAVVATVPPAAEAPSVAPTAPVAPAATVAPIAARDLAIWMGSDRDADRVAIMRRIVKLEARGWLMITRTMAAKHRLLPSRGRDQTGAVRPWCFDISTAGARSICGGAASRSACWTIIWAGWSRNPIPVEH